MNYYDSQACEFLAIQDQLSIYLNHNFGYYRIQLKEAVLKQIKYFYLKSHCFYKKRKDVRFLIVRKSSSYSRESRIKYSVKKNRKKVKNFYSSQYQISNLELGIGVLYKEVKSRLSKNNMRIN